MARYGITLQAASGKLATVTVDARTDTGACNRALRKLTKSDPGQGWRVLDNGVHVKDGAYSLVLR